MEVLGEEEEEEEFSIWYKCEQFYKIWSQQWIMLNIKSMSIYMSSGAIIYYAHEKRKMALAMRVCLLKSTVIGNIIYQTLDSDYGKFDRWNNYQPELSGLRGKRRMAEAEVFIKWLIEMDDLNKSMNALRFTEHEG